MIFDSTLSPDTMIVLVLHCVYDTPKEARELELAATQRVAGMLLATLKV